MKLPDLMTVWSTDTDGYFAYYTTQVYACRLRKKYGILQEKHAERKGKQKAVPHNFQMGTLVCSAKEDDTPVLP